MTRTTTSEAAATGAGPTRRQVLVAGGAVAAVAAVAACAPARKDDDEKAGSPAASASGTTLKTADVPEGGGTILRDVQVVVTQPTKGTFKAFSAVCTHEGCLVAKVADGAIDCPCHGAQFSIADGAVLAGPAPSPLDSVPLTVADGTITLS